MDDFNNSYNFQSPPETSSPVQNTPTPAPSNGLATTALVMGICSLVFICCGGGLVLGALGIIFAILSRGADQMNSQAKVGLGLSIGGFSLTVIALVIYLPLIIHSDEFQSRFNEEFNRRYGEYYYDSWDYDYEDILDQYEDFDYEDILDQYEDFDFPDWGNKSGDT